MVVEYDNTSLRSYAGGSRVEPNALTITTELVNDSALVTVIGEVDLASADQFRTELDVALRGSRGVVLDVGRMSFIDSSGLNALVKVRRDAQSAGHDLVIRNPRPMFRELLQITRLEALFVIEGDGENSTPLPEPGT